MEVFVPFGEFRHYSGNDAWERVGSLLKLVGLYLPVGLLAGCLPGRFWSRDHLWRVALAAMGLAVSIEAGQLLVATRTSSATDALVGAAAAAAGWRLTHSKPGKE